MTASPAFRSREIRSLPRGHLLVPLVERQSAGSPSDARAPLRALPDQRTARSGAAAPGAQAATQRAPEVTGCHNSPVPTTYRLIYLDGKGGLVWARESELTQLDPLPPLAVGARVKIAGVPCTVVERMEDGRYVVEGEIIRSGVRHRKQWVAERWRLAFQ